MNGRSPSLSVFDRAHPRPQFRRAGWTSLDGEWNFALDPEARWTRPDSAVWSDTIRVPFAPETSNADPRPALVRTMRALP